MVYHFHMMQMRKVKFKDAKWLPVILLDSLPPPLCLEVKQM